MNLDDLTDEDREVIVAWRRLPPAARPLAMRFMLRMTNGVPIEKARQAFRAECYAAGVVPPCDA